MCFGTPSSSVPRASSFLSFPITARLGTHPRESHTATHKELSPRLRIPHAVLTFTLAQIRLSALPRLNQGRVTVLLALASAISQPGGDPRFNCASISEFIPTMTLESP